MILALFLSVVILDILIIIWLHDQLKSVEKTLEKKIITFERRVEKEMERIGRCSQQEIMDCKNSLNERLQEISKPKSPKRTSPRTVKAPAPPC